MSLPLKICGIVVRVQVHKLQPVDHMQSHTAMLCNPQPPPMRLGRETLARKHPLSPCPCSGVQEEVPFPWQKGQNGRSQPREQLRGGILARERKFLETLKPELHICSKTRTEAPSEFLQLPQRHSFPPFLPSLLCCRKLHPLA